MRLSAEQKRVLALSKTLLPLDEEVKNYWNNVIDGEYTAHHCDMLTFSYAVEDYQVLRSVDVEIEPYPYPEYRLTEKQQLEFEKRDEDYDWLIEEFFDGDFNEAYYEHEEKEVLQRWINLKTGQITVLGKIYMDNPEKFSFNKRSRWRVVNGKHKGAATKTFWQTFRNYYGTGFYQDVTVHPILEKYGYQGINAMEWWIDCASVVEERQPQESIYFARHAYNEGWDHYLLNTSKGQNPDEKLIKILGYDTFFKYDALEDDIKQQYLTAYKIAIRHKYDKISDSLWHDMVLNLISLQKDIHNPYYVCPDNLQKAHQRYLNQYTKMQARLKLEKNMLQAMADNDRYIKVCKKFLNIILKQNDIVIRPLRSVEEFVQEGEIMHNCVYSMGYYKKSNTLILTAQNTQEEHLATIELDTQQWKIRQLRAPCNKTCEREKEISQIIYSNINIFKRAALKRTA